MFRKHCPSTKSWHWRSGKWTKVWKPCHFSFNSSPTELRHPECIYDEVHCSAFCEKAAAAWSKREVEQQQPPNLGSTTEHTTATAAAGSTLQAIRLVLGQAQVLQLAQSFVVSVENHFLMTILVKLLMKLLATLLVTLLATLLVTLHHCRVSPAKCLCDSGDCRAFVRLERCHSRISVR